MSGKINGKAMINKDVVEFIKERNEAQSIEYTDPSVQAARRLYRVQHPTEIVVMKCMDGRLNLALYTETPPGIIEPVRNIGGQFDFGWPFFQEVVNDSVNEAINKGRKCVLITSYHFSKGDHHRGCAGFGYDTEGAKVAAFHLRERASYVYGNRPRRAIYALTIGIETDEESLTFHGSNGGTLNIADLDPNTSTAELRQALEGIYPDMDGAMLHDILPLVEGNLHHIQSLRASGREPIDLEHREQIIAVGRGFDWLHMPNAALIIGPYSHEWPTAVATAGTIVKGNIAAGRIPVEHGILLMVNALWKHDEGEAGRRLKEEKVRYLFREAYKALIAKVPELAPKLRFLAGVVHHDTRKLETIDVSIEDLQASIQKAA